MTEIDYSKLSPMMRQYFEIKNTVDDAILFYRLGDFYEMFFDDAVTGSRELELTLTGRDCGLESRAPMCGVPYHAVENYIARLVARGYKVAVCEQAENPALAKGLVCREIIRIVTPGTVTDASMLNEAKNNYIAAIYRCFDSDTFALCFADVSTGVVHISALLDIKQALTELRRFSPTELVYTDSCAALEPLSRYVKAEGICANVLYDGYFDLDAAKQAVMQQFDPSCQKLLLSMRNQSAVCALGALVRYIRETQKNGAQRLIELHTYSPDDYMFISGAAVHSLELFETMRAREKRGSLLWVLDRTCTAMGKRMLRGALEKPLLDAKAISARQNSTAELYGNSILLAQAQQALGGVSDFERIMTKIVYRTASPRELNAFAATARKLSELKAVAAAFKSPFLKGCFSAVDPLEDMRDAIESAISEEPPALMKDSGYIRRGFDSVCDECSEMVSSTKAYIAGVEKALKEETGIKNLKVGYNRVFGYYIEVSKSNTEAVPDSFIRKQTLTTGERYITDELKKLEEQILSAGERLAARERQLYAALLDTLTAQLPRVQKTAGAVAAIDMICSFAEVSLRNNYCKPQLNTSGKIEILNGRHPVIERVSSAGAFVPNSCLLDANDNLISIITGPNMAGKSTYMRQTALICIMSQIGCFVPAKSADLCIVDKLFTRVGASDDLFSGQSTFMVEMTEVADILQNATPDSLLILDEVGRGTSTFDGMSIARAVLEYICENVKAKTLFATHFHEITAMAAVFSGINNYNIAVKKRGDEITFLRRVVEGCADDSYGIEVAMLAGIPRGVTDRAREILNGLEKGTDVVKIRSLASAAMPEKSHEKLYEAVRALNPETLTPIEAMIKLSEISLIAKEENQ